MNYTAFYADLHGRRYLSGSTWLLVFFLFVGSNGWAQVSAVRNAFDDAAANGFSGVLLVAEKGRVLFESAAGYRSFEQRVPLRSDDIFELASVSKQFTAMVIMMLQQKGLLRYDDLVEKYIDLPFPGVTIRHLLQHTGGLPDYQEMMDKHWNKSRVAGNEDVLEYLKRFAPPMKFKPGERYEYSNTGYLLLASIAEKITGEGFIGYVRRRIFNKLQMSQTDIRTLEEKAAVSNFALGHLRDSSRAYVHASRFPASDYTIWLGNRRGPGRISSCAQDLLKWDQALYTSRLVKKRTLREAYEPGRLNNGSISRYGFGWELPEESGLGPVVQHSGDNPGYSTEIVRYLHKRYTIILLCNNAHPAFGSLLASVKQALAGL